MVLYQYQSILPVLHDSMDTGAWWHSRTMLSGMALDAVCQYRILVAQYSPRRLAKHARQPKGKYLNDTR